MKTILLLLGVFILAVGIFLFTQNLLGGNGLSFLSKTATAKIKDTEVKLSVADTPKGQQKGLSGRKSLASDRGMLFVFKTPDYYSFWMKGMKFPIDIIYLRGEKVVTIYKNIQPPKSANDTSLPVYTPEEPSDKVIEVNANFSDKHGLKKGDSVSITL